MVKDLALAVAAVAACAAPVAAWAAADQAGAGSADNGSVATGSVATPSVAVTPSTAPPAPLRLCADPANLPFSTDAADAARNGRPGLYVEIGQAVADALGRPLQTVWSQSIFGKRNLRTTLLAGQCDLAVGLPATSDFMGPRLVFSRPILQLGYALVLPAGHPATGIDGLAGLRVAVQFGTPPQALVATRPDITGVTVMDPEEGMRRLAAGEADAAFLWSAQASWLNHAQWRDRWQVLPVAGAQMQYPAAIGFARQQSGLRDQVDAVLPALMPRLRELAARYGVPTGAAPTAAPALAASASTSSSAAWSLRLAAGPGTQLALAEAVAQAATGAEPGDDPAKGKEVFNGTCSHCHGPNAVVEDRKINLRRLRIKYGDQVDETFYATVTNGRPTKGMPAWKDVFTKQDFANILAYLKTLQEKAP